jgi:hypothetical protein
MSDLLPLFSACFPLIVPMMAPLEISSTGHPSCLDFKSHAAGAVNNKNTPFANRNTCISVSGSQPNLDDLAKTMFSRKDAPAKIQRDLRQERQENIIQY